SLSNGGRPNLRRTGRSPSLQCFNSPRMVKQILLCVTAMVAEVSLCERTKPRRVQFSRPRKIVFPQDTLDPDVDWECAQPLIGKEHHTISNLHAYARQLAQTPTKIDIRQDRQFFKIDTTRRN